MFKPPKMKIVRVIVASAAVLALVLFLGEPGVAQPPPALPGSPDQAPIDGGLGALAAAGVAYAIKKLRDRNKA